MPIGVSLQLFSATTAQASIGNIQALWWDVEQPKDAGKPVGRSNAVTTDANGFITLDLSGVTELALGGSGFLTLYRLDPSDHRDSLVFSGKVQTSNVDAGVSMVVMTSPPIVADGDWVRHPLWLPLPVVEDTEQKVVGLYRINRDVSFITVVCEGDYTVDWGDGSVPQNFASGITAEHIYDWNNAQLADTNYAVTLVDTGNLVSRVEHGLTNGEKIQLHNIDSTAKTTNLSEGMTGYVINATTDTFQVSETLGGPPVTIILDGTATLLAYKQAIVTITPQATHILTKVDFRLRHSIAGNVRYSTGWLDLLVSSPFLTSLNVSENTQMVRWGYLEQFQLISENEIASFAYMFKECLSLKSIPILNTSYATNFRNMFDSCYSLTSFPSFDTSNGTNFTNMFNYCYSLTSVPHLNTESGITFSGMFANCSSLTSIPHFNTSNGTNFSGMFASCDALAYMPLLDTSNGTNFGGMFQYCSSLTSIPHINTANGTDFGGMFSGHRGITTVPLLDTSNGTSFGSMFNGCVSLTSIPLLDTSKSQGFGYMFGGCVSLTSIPLLDTSNATDFSGMFVSCNALTSIPHLNTSKGISFSSMFQSDFSLTTIPPLNTANGTSFSNIFNTCNSLSVGALAGTSKAPISYVLCSLSGEQLDAIYTALGTATGSSGANRTINVTGNHGTATHTPSIATAKGWTVTA